MVKKSTINFTEWKFSPHLQQEIAHADAGGGWEYVGESIRQAIINCGKNPDDFGSASLWAELEPDTTTEEAVEETPPMTTGSEEK